MHWARVLISVVGSVWFVPVSCSLSLYAGIHLTSEIDARDVSKGDDVHTLFSVVVDSESNDESFMVVKKDNIQQYRELIDSDSTSSLSFLMSKPSGRKRTDTADYSYQVIDGTNSEQTIEVVETYHDGDNTIWSRYKANHSQVAPISSRMLYFGYMFTAFPYAVAFAFLIYAAGRYFKRRTHAPRVIAGDS